MSVESSPKGNPDGDKITTLNREAVALHVRDLGGDKKAARVSILRWMPDIDEGALDKVLDSLDDSEIS